MRVCCVRREMYYIVRTVTVVVYDASSNDSIDLPPLLLTAPSHVIKKKLGVCRTLTLGTDLEK